MKSRHLSAAIAIALSAVVAGVSAQDAQTGKKPAARSSVFSTSNTTTSNGTKRVQQMQGVSVSGQSASLGGGLMTAQDAPKAVSTVTREAIAQAPSSSNFTQMLATIPGVNTATVDATGLNDGQFTMRGFYADEIGVTVNGAPVNDAGNYAIWATQYGDTENMGDITVTQGFPDVDMATAAAVGGSVAWVSLMPSHKAGLDVSAGVGSNDYRRGFVRLNTGDTGPVRSWLSYSNNTASLWRGGGKEKVTKLDGKSVWTIDDKNSIAASLQYAREFRINYQPLTKAQTQEKYDQGYTNSYDPGASPFDNLNYYKYQTDPFRSWTASVDGEFTLTDSLHLSVVPYFQYGYGGGGFGLPLFESTTPATQLGYPNVNQDANGNGVVRDGEVGVGYGFFYSNTFRPGVIVKFNQDLGLDDSLEYGFWYDRPRQQQGTKATPVDQATGVPADYWADTASVIRLPSGRIEKGLDTYATAESRKFFATNTWTPNDQWTVTLGATYLWASREGWEYLNPGTTLQAGGPVDLTFHKITPNGGVKFQLDDKNQFYASLGQTFRAPTATAALNTALSPSSRISPETAWTADLGWRFYGDGVSASVDAFTTNFKNRLVSGSDPAMPANTLYVSLPKAKTSGLNAEASYAISENWKVYGSYAYTHAINHSDMIGPGSIDGTSIRYATDGKTLVNTPRNLTNFTLSYGNGPFWASLNTRYTSSQWADWANTEHFGGYTTVNLNAGWNFQDISSYFRKPYIRLNVSNLFSRKALAASDTVGDFQSSGTAVDSTGAVVAISNPAVYKVLQTRAVMLTFGASFF
jgi:iron complex outermembrane receptor protein